MSRVARYHENTYHDVNVELIDDGRHYRRDYPWNHLFDRRICRDFHLNNLFHSYSRWYLLEQLNKLDLMAVSSA